MQSTLPETTSRATLASMVGIEARRFARHPLFLIGVAISFGLLAFIVSSPQHRSASGEEIPSDFIAWTIIPAFFIGLTSLVVAARLTRSTDVSVEAVGTAPESEARRTLAVVGACVVPLIAGLVWIAALILVAQIRGHHPQELWFGTLPSLTVWSLLLASGVVSCLGGALLGVLVGRWLRFPGAPVVAVVVLVALTMVGQMTYAYDPELSRYRLWVPWAMFHTGTMAEAGGYEGIPENTQAILPGNPTFYLLYVLLLCALAVGGAVWHDRTARTPLLRVRLIGLVVAVGAVLLLAMFVGHQEFVVSDPLPLVWST